MIVSLETQHLPACAALYASVFNGEPWRNEWSLESARQRLEEIFRTPGYLGLVLKREDNVVALVMGVCKTWYDGAFYELEEACVERELQGQGLGSVLYQTLEQRLRERGVGRILLATLAASPAEKFYFKHGFQPSSGRITRLWKVLEK